MIDESPRLTPQDILVVDDVQSNLQFLTSLLTQAGYRVRPASGGLLALRSVTAKAPHLILLDVKMPDIDGYEVCRRLKADERTRDIPVLFISGMASSEQKLKGFRSGGVDYITKPFEPQEVLARVKTHLQLRELSERLEQKVIERTAELAATNARLEEEVAERMQAAIALQREQRFIKNIIDSMPSIVVSVDTQGRITQWNKQAETTSGIAADMAKGRLLRDSIPHLADQSKILAAMDTGKIQQDSRVPRSEPKGRRFEDVTYFPLIANGVEGVVIRVDDTTERTRIEEMLAQSDKMLALGGLAAGMAHEIKSPLAAIIASAQVVRQRIFDDTTRNRETSEACSVSFEGMQMYMEKRKIGSLLGSISESGIRAGRIITNMLEFSQTSPGTHSQHDIAALLDKAIDLVSYDFSINKEFGFSTIEIIRKYDNSLPMIYCGGDEMQQVFFNIVKNAAEAIAEKDYCGNAKQITLSTYRAGGSACVEITDNGPGMDETTRKSVFNPFFTNKKRRVGTGLGLYVSYLIVTKQHQGTIEVGSSPGEGANFIITIPFQGSPAAGSETP